MQTKESREVSVSPIHSGEQKQIPSQTRERVRTDPRVSLDLYAYSAEFRYPVTHVSIHPLIFYKLVNRWPMVRIKFFFVTARSSSKTIQVGLERLPSG